MDADPRQARRRSPKRAAPQEAGGRSGNSDRALTPGKAAVLQLPFIKYLQK